ncbi:MAG TPA: maleylpyruvate isomerase N-terminal domain-containing protein [Nocardioidaceae bacterium]|nr:maleylpyruvate isomerase N-terminal domain-containing protein [Nocardioidaceae bacterium]
MSSWNAMSYDGKDTILRVVRDQAQQFFAMVDSEDAWQMPTGAGHWQVRDIVAHLVDTTEAYFPAFDAARSHSEVEPAYGLPGMAARVDERATALRTESRGALVERLRGDFDKMMEIFEALTEEDWTNLLVPHFYMGPLPSFFYPAFQLMDYGVHGWDLRQGTGRAHGLTGDVADLLTPFMFVLWKYTVTATDVEPCEVGIRITTGPNAGDTRVSVGPDGLDYAPGDVSDLPATIEFDPGSFVLTAFGRGNFGTIRGDRAVADRYLNVFFRI